MRAYSPNLQLHGVEKQDFVEFLDTLVVMESVPASLQALDAVGKVVGVV